MLGGTGSHAALGGSSFDDARMPAMRRLRLALVPAAAAILSACVSTGTAPEHLGPLFCRADPALVGVWHSTRMSQLGPASMTLAFECDCTYRAKTRVFWLIAVRETGRYWQRNGRLSLSRASGAVTAWPWKVEGGRLLLEEAEGEVHAYRRTRERRCR